MLKGRARIFHKGLLRSSPRRLSWLTTRMEMADFFRSYCCPSNQQAERARVVASSVFVGTETLLSGRRMSIRFDNQILSPEEVDVLEYLFLDDDLGLRRCG